MSLRLGNERVQAMAAFRSRHRAEMLSVVLTELVGLTRLRQERGDAEALRFKQEHDAVVREVIRNHAEGLEVAVQGDRFFFAFAKPSVAVAFSVRLQARLRDWNRERSLRLGDRIGIHVGEVILETSLESGSIHGLNGLEVDRCERVSTLAEPGRILMTRPAFDMARTAMQGRRLEDGPELRWIHHGSYQLSGLAEPMEICEVVDRSHVETRPPADSEMARRIPPPDDFAAAVPRASIGRGALVVVFVAAVLLPFREGFLAASSYDLAYFLRRSTADTSEAVIVAIDEESYRRKGLPRSTPWDRGEHAEMVERLGQCGARAVVLDFFFRDAETHRDRSQADERLVEAVRKSGKVVVVAQLLKDGNEVSLVPPFPSLAAHVRSGGVSRPTSDEESDKETRAMFFERETLPSLPRELARLLNVPVPEVGHSPPWLNYYGPPGTIETHSYAVVMDDLRNGRHQDRFRDRIVFVGRDDRGMEGLTNPPDLWTTPYILQGKGRSTGVEVVATASLNLLRGEGLRRLSGWTELAILLVTGAGAVGLVGRTPPLLGLGLAAGAAGSVAWIGMASVWWTHVWFPWLIVSAVQLPLAVVWCTLARLDRRHRAPLPAPSEGERRESTAVVEPPTASNTAPDAGRTPTARGREFTTANATTQATPYASASDSRLPGVAVDPPSIPIPIIPDYHVLRLIGKGGYGEVWLCRSTSGIHRAVKVIRRANFAKDKPYDQEFEGIRRYEPVSLSHPSLLAILHVGRRDIDGYFFYVMELGDDVRSPNAVDPATYEPRNLAKDIRLAGRLSVGDSLRLGEDLAGALEVLHQQGLLHRDIKPANIIFLKGVPKLADIGLVTAANRDADSVSFVGTIGYIAPEGPRSVASDIFSLGKVLYEASSGIPACEFPELPATLLERADCAEFLRLNDLVLRACEMDPKRRFATASEFREAMRALRLELASTA